MRVVILAGGLGTRLSEETVLKPKPMVEIGGMPILWHIMKIYSANGFNDFIVCLGYKGYLIKEYFANYFLHKSDVTIDLTDNSIKVHDSQAEPWKITLVDTGHESMTGGRIKRIQSYLNNEPFMLTYGDGVGNINIKALLKFHRDHGKFCTVTSVQPSGRFGALNILPDNSVHSFMEKPKGDGAWINGGYFVCQPEIFNYIKDGDKTIWEQQPMEQIANDGQMNSYKHTEFWRPMDTLKDKHDLNEMWEKGISPWKIW
ncbi:glucose-1-phosphate cytidylyltransferase [Mucilaginibacter segetis]|uniref:Glucose-1-phosphate cytidylyltransferase n=1 Tax=Mucilaginibacter segetis TaxID=2793071 RepID=A0A934PY35_9SPHI|nr:glucose-1-phosphate cytidylyltransferase [Mucilaginibacter segetis]MBK0381133.1 glucose-1-phosphate cytidylyltransferase [Mucilaginibacter segetis]